MSMPDHQLRICAVYVPWRLWMLDLKKGIDGDEGWTRKADSGGGGGSTHGRGSPTRLAPLRSINQAVEKLAPPAGVAPLHLLIIIIIIIKR